MKKKYMEPECTVVNFENEDIVTTSGNLTSLSKMGDNDLNFELFNSGN